MPIITFASTTDRMLDLPVFHKSYDFIITLSEYISKFPKKDRFTIGVRIENTSYDLLSMIMRANYETSAARKNLLLEASTILDMLKILVRLAKDKKILHNNQYIILEERLYEIGRMLGGWMRSLHNNNDNTKELA